MDISKQTIHSLIEVYLKQPRIRKLLEPSKSHDFRRYFSYKYLRGSGLEIGALHRPVSIKPGVKIKYIDYKSREENIKRYPELAGETIVKTDIIDNGFFLKKIKNNSKDFIIANHFLEHSPDPIGTVKTLCQKLKLGGILFLGVPILEKNYDNGRKLTSMKHFVEDSVMFEDEVPDFRKIKEKAREHMTEFLLISDANIRKDNGMKVLIRNLQDAEREADKIMVGFYNELEKLSKLSYDNKHYLNTYESLMNVHISKINLLYDIHYHTFSLDSYKDFFKILEFFNDKIKVKLLDISESGGGEIIAIGRKIL